jgi:RpiR family transcriptional regulator, murPQ operon repressor
MKNILVKLQEYIMDASTAEKDLVNFLLSRPEEAIGCSVQLLAQKTYCSPSTIMRLCWKLGFSGYKELQKSLIQDVALEKENALGKMEDINPGDSLEQMVEKVTYKNMISLDNTRKLVDLDVLAKAINLLIQCDTLYLFGIGSSLLIARDAYLKFLRINKACCISDDWHAQLLQAKNIKPNDLAIIISYSGFTEEMLTCARNIKKNGAPIIAITRSDESPLAKLSDLNLRVASSEVLIRTGAMSSRISQLNIIDILYVSYINRNYDESISQLKRTYISKLGTNSGTDADKSE